MTYQSIRIEREGPVGLVVFTRETTNNTVDADMMAEICAGLAELDADDDVRAIVLTAVGKHFCAGADFAFLKTLTVMPAAQVHDRIYRYFQGAARQLFRSAKPTVAAVDGAAITVGCELALTCDFRIVTDRALFQESWIKLGLLPPLGGMYLLPRIVGLGLANEMILRGRSVRGEEAVRVGLASELVAPEQLRARALELAGELGALPPRAYALAKNGVQRGLESSMDREWAAGVLAQAMLLGAEDYREGLAAAVEKRPGAFTGR